MAWDKQDWFGLVNAIGSVATAIGVIYAIRQGVNAQRVTLQELKWTNRARHMEILKRTLFVVVSGKEPHKHILQCFDNAVNFGLMSSDVLTVLVEVFIERGLDLKHKPVTPATAPVQAQNALLESGVTADVFEKWNIPQHQREFLSNL